ncbi:MAG: ImcF-related family protein [Gemmatimonadaceae bacterium]
MTRPTKAWLTALCVFLAYVVVAVFLAFALKLHGKSLWQMVVALSVLGFISAGIVLWFLRDQLRTPKPGTPASGVDATLTAAQAQLAKSGKGAASKLGALPILLVLGPDGGAKTTTVSYSGLGPELLAGDVYREGAIAPTNGVNLWFANKTVMVEAGGRLLNDAPGWLRLVRQLRPRSLSAALTGKPQPPRLAVVCVGCDEFYRPGSNESVPGIAKIVRARLGEAAAQFGVSLPTYVVFTKADAVPYFDGYTRNLTDDEAHEALGASVEPDSGGAGTYSDRITPLLTQSLNDLFMSLAERRLDVLGREVAPEWKPAAYEFPREFRKLVPLVVDFLREVGRPSELEMSPVLRGFYFTGVQAILVPEAVAATTVKSELDEAVRSATGVFAIPGAQRNAPTPPVAGGMRRVPRWDFLPRLFREVVFGDAAAVQVTAAGARVGFWRRVGLGTLSAVALILGLLFTFSFVGNSHLEQQALDATRGIAALPPNPVDLPPVDPLRRLDGLRIQVDTLSRYEHSGAPLSLRWGLYAGGRLYDETRAAYFAGFNKLMFGNTRAAMLSSLRGLPDAPRPTDDYGDIYSLLKAYIITTSHPEKSTPEFLSPVLMTRWLAGRPVDSVRAQLARKQFETYATELPYANPFPDTADAAAVSRARSFLRQFAGSERIYQFMLAEAAKKNPGVQFNKNVPGSAQFVVDAYEVPGAFTKGGAVFMLDAFKTVNKYLKGESWVVGEDAGQVDQAKLAAELQTRYSNDYIAQWRRFLQSAQVVRYSGVKDAATKLAALSGNQSPLLALFSIAAQNTAVPLPDVAKTFQPVQTVTPGTITDKLVGPGNEPYVAALRALQSSLDQTANAQGPAADAAAGQAAGNATAAKAAALQIASNFTIDEPGVHTLVQTLMEAPITYAEPMLRNFGSAEINVRARAFCSIARPLLAKFPFSPDATAQASLAEVAAVLKPGSGSLWRFYDEALQAALPKQGNQFVPSGTGSVKLTPGFVTFMNRAATWADIMFKDDSPEPHLSFTVQPMPSEAFTSVTLSLDGEVLRSSASGNVASARVDWPGAGHEAKLAAQLGTTEATLVGPYTGPWAVFQLFAVADEWKPAASGFRVGWELSTHAQRAQLPNGSGAKVIVQIDAGPASTVLRKGFFSGSECAGDIAK